MKTQPARLRDELADFTRVAELFGGAALLRRNVASPIQAHDLLVAGLPRPALANLLVRLGDIGGTKSVERLVGLSHRSLQRRRDAPDLRMTPYQSGRAWKLAAVFAKASEVLGSESEARRWLGEPAMALNRYRPIDLLASPVGAELVENLLLQLEYGVYA